MKDYIEKRAREIGEYVVKTGQTVRETAEQFGISKSTVHFDVSKRLKRIDYALYEEAQKVLSQNFSERHLRGGESTRLKYEKQKSAKTKVRIT